MCSQTFNRPSDWVRHIEFTHADMAENRRKRRKVLCREFFIAYIHTMRDYETRKRGDFRTIWPMTTRISRLWSAIYVATCIPRHRSGCVTYRRSTRKSSWPWWTTRRPPNRKGFTITKSYATYVKRNSQVTLRWSSIKERIRAKSLSFAPTVKKASM